jgi:outer membrane protein assembly factor BamB
MRRHNLVPVVAALVIALGACARSSAEPLESQQQSPADPSTTTTAPAPAPDPLLFLSGRDEVVAVRTTDGSVSYRGHAGMAAPDRSAIVQVVGRQVVAVDPFTGDARWTHPIPAGRRVRVVSRGAELVALVDGELLTPSDPRATTELVIADANGARALTVEGNIDPEAFLLDGTTLVAVEYLPALNPDHYAVRLVDLATGAVRPVPDQPGHHPDNAPRERMQGYARTQVASADGRFLYTYYASPEGVHDELGTFYAFVHVLDLEHGWAYCIDLAEPFGTGGEGWSEPALAITPDGERLIVTDRVTGALAAIDTETLDVVASSLLEPASAPEHRPVASASADVVYLGLARELLRVDRATLRVLGTTVLADPLTGLKVDSTGAPLYAVTTTGILALDPDGDEIARFTLPAAGTSGADPAAAVPASGAYKCAC